MHILLTHDIPVDEKSGLQAMHSLTRELEMRISPYAPFYPFHITIGDVHAAHETDLSIYHHDLAVIAVVHFVG